MQMVGQMQTQAEARRLDAKQRVEAQRAEARQREEAQRGEALKTEAVQTAEAKAREQILVKMKAETDEATRKQVQLFMEHELKRQKVLVDANTALQQEKLKVDMNRQIANLEAIERREAQFQQLQEERERARNAQLKLRELATQDLKERVHLERELVKQQQQNLLLQKQREINPLEIQADKNLFQQRQVSSGRQALNEKLATVREEVATPSPEAVVAELTDSDTPPPSQNRPKPARRTPVIVDVSTQECPVSASEPPVLGAALVSESQPLGAATEIPLPTSDGPLVIPKGPEVAATPQPVVNPHVGKVVYTAGARPIGSLVSGNPLGDPVSHLPLGLTTHPAFAQQSVVPPVPTLPFIPSSVPAAPSLYAGSASTCVTSMPPSGVGASILMTVIGADTRPTYVSLSLPLSSAPPIVDTKAVPLASAATSVGVPPTSQESAVGSSGQTSGMVGPVAVPPAPTVVVKQPEPVRPYTGTTSYKAYKEYFERICVFNEWKTPTECARHLLVAMDGSASEAVRGLKAEKNTDLALIWEALSRRFGFVDEQERAMCRFDVRKQLEGETCRLRAEPTDATPGSLAED